MADKRHGVWRSGNRYALPTSPHPRRRLLELRNSCVTLTHPTAQKIGHSTTAKSKRQLIFATHNANFVVNGDADKVISLAPGSTSDEVNNNEARIMIEIDGAIETPAVRNIISDTVEGGREAFELRSRKYLFTK